MHRRKIILFYFEICKLVLKKIYLMIPKIVHVFLIYWFRLFHLFGKMLLFISTNAKPVNAIVLCGDVACIGHVFQRIDVSIYCNASRFEKSIAFCLYKQVGLHWSICLMMYIFNWLKVWFWLWWPLNISDVNVFFILLLLSLHNNINGIA